MRGKIRQRAGSIKELKTEPRELLFKSDEALVYVRPYAHVANYGIRGNILRVQRKPRKERDPLVFFYATRLLRLVKPRLRTITITTARRPMDPPKENGKRRGSPPDLPETYSHRIRLTREYQEMVKDYYLPHEADETQSIRLTAEQKKQISKDAKEAEDAGFFLNTTPPNTGITPQGKIVYFEVEVSNPKKIESCIRNMPEKTVKQKENKKKALNFLERWKTNAGK